MGCHGSLARLAALAAAAAGGLTGTTGRSGGSRPVARESPGVAGGAGLAAWLADRPQLGVDVFVRGAPEWVGTALANSYQVDVVGFLWGSMALFDDGARDVDTTIVYGPPWHDLHSPLDARRRILAVLASLPEGASLERFLPPIQADDDRRARPGLRRRSAWATTLLAGLELARHAEVYLAQEGAFTPIHMRRADTKTITATVPVEAEAFAAG